MKAKKQLSILEFSRLTGINRDNLRYYDRIGLLSPENRGDNRYRYYSRHQLNTAYLIMSLRGMGVGIEEIKQFVKDRTPEKTIALYDKQDALIQEKIKQLNEVREIMKMYLDMMKEALAHKENVPFLENKDIESIFLCPPIPLDMNEDEGGIFSYEQAELSGINSDFPMGITFCYDEEKIMTMSTDDRYYFKVVHNGNEMKPSGQYAVIYGWVDPFHPSKLYKKLWDYIQQNNLQICGNIYEEYPLDDFSKKETNNYVRIEVPVCSQ